MVDTCKINFMLEVFRLGDNSSSGDKKMKDPGIDYQGLSMFFLNIGNSF